MPQIPIIKVAAIIAVIVLAYQTVRGQSAGELIAKGDLSDVTFHAGDALKRINYTY